MKVVVISHSAVVDVYREKFHCLARMGCELHLVLPQTWPEAGSLVAAPPTGKEKDIWLHPLPGHFLGRISVFYLPGLGPLLKKLQPEIIHLEEEPFSLIAWQTFRILRALSTRLVFFTWENILRSYRWPLNWIDHMILSHAHWAIAGNQAAKQVLQQRGFHGQSIVIPQYGVNTQRFTERAHPRAETNKMIIGYIGRLVEEKGIATLLRAVAALDIPWQLRITGTGPYLATLQQIIKTNNWEKRVVLQPALPNAAMPQALQELDVLVLPSETRPLWKEQFGRVLIEAMACGIPVIGSDSGEIPHVIGEAGLIFPEGQWQILAQKLKHLQQEPAQAADLARQGRQRVLEYFTTEKIASQIFAWYQKMCEEQYQ